jgi:AGZA family xanthine/uracil permease-like MFS transporter
MSTSAHWLERRFELRARGSTVGREVRGAVATFLTMAYILFVNPDILANAGVPRHSAVACTALAAAVCCVLMGLVANLPIALASGMGLNAMVAFQLAGTTHSWQTAMGIIVLDGLVILVLVLLGMREAVMRAIPHDLRLAIGAGIGLFIAFIGAVNGGLVVRGNPSGGPPLLPGQFDSKSVLVCVVGLLVTAVLMARRVKGSLLIGIALGTVVALALHVSELPKGFARPSFEAAFQADVKSALKLAYLPLLVSVMMVDFFDTLGTATAIVDEAGLIDANGRIPGLKRLLIVDSLSASIGGMLGASSVTSYVESAAGVAEGARTGLHSVVVGLLFAVCIFAAPVVGVVPAQATAPALILVGFYMMGQFARVDFERLETAIPAFITLLTIPLTWSISHGIGYGFIAYVVIQVTSLRFAAVHPAMYVTAAAFAAFFVWGQV